MSFQDTNKGLTPIPNSKNTVILSSHPTQADLNRAEKENKIIISIHHKPDTIVDIKTAEAYKLGFLTALGLEPNYRLALYLIDKNLDIEIYSKWLINELEKEFVDINAFRIIITEWPGGINR